MTNLELFKQALNEAMTNKFDKVVGEAYREELLEVIKEVAPEHTEEFSKAYVAEIECEFITYIGDKHYFDFKKIDGKFELLSINEIVYW